MDQNRTSMREVNLRQSHKATDSSNERIQPLLVIILGLADSYLFHT